MTRAARRDLHAAIFAVHESLDRLEDDGALERMDYLLLGAERLFLSGVERFDQLKYCLEIYGRPTPPLPIPLTSSPKGARA